MELKGKIIKNISDLYQVKTNNNIYLCKARGIFRKDKLVPLVGDLVIIDSANNVILKIEKRINELIRPKVSNVDIALITTSVKEPNLSLNLLDKEITSVILANVEPVICFTKLDKLTNDELKDINELIKYYKNLDIKVFKNNDLEPLIGYLRNKTVVLTGQSGVGKSTLLNKLDNNLKLKEGAISMALGRGKHTTRHTELYVIKDIYFVDTPGFSSLDLNNYKKEDIKNTFKEFLKYPCKFKDCTHIKEQECEVKKAKDKGLILASRYENYCNFISKVK